MAKTLQQIREKLSDHRFERHDDLNDDAVRSRFSKHEHRAIERYGGDSDDVNHYMRHKEDTTRHGDAPELVKHMKSALTRHRTKNDRHFYRGGDDDISDNYKKDVHHKGFISTSGTRGGALNFAPDARDEHGDRIHHVMKIRVRKGTKHIPLHSARGTPGDSEHEHVFGPGTLRHTGKVTKHVNSFNDRPYHMHHYEYEHNLE